MSDRPVLICPLCEESRLLSEEAYRMAVRELLEWDRRFDRPETILDSLISVLSDAR